MPSLKSKKSSTQSLWSLIRSSKISFSNTHDLTAVISWTARQPRSMLWNYTDSQKTVTMGDNIIGDRPCRRRDPRRPPIPVTTAGHEPKPQESQTEIGQWEAVSKQQRELNGATLETTTLEAIQSQRPRRHTPNHPTSGTANRPLPSTPRKNHAAAGKSRNNLTTNALTKMLCAINAGSSQCFSKQVSEVTTVTTKNGIDTGHFHRQGRFSTVRHDQC